LKRKASETLSTAQTRRLVRRKLRDFCLAIGLSSREIDSVNGSKQDHRSYFKAKERRMATAQITLIGGPTALIEVAGYRLLTDPTFDPPGDYELSYARFTKTGRPAVRFAAAVAPIRHSDNGRAPRDLV